MKRHDYVVIGALVVGLIAAGVWFYLAYDRYEWLYPQAKWGLLVLPLMAIWYFWAYRTSAGVLKNASFDTLKELPESKLAYLRHGLIGLRMVAVAMLVVVLGRPQSSDETINQTTEGIDIVMAMDVSGSMLARDFKPNRLESAKVVAEQFVNGRSNDRIAVVVYEGQSYTQVPLTSDHRVVRSALEDLQAGLIEGGTAIGMGLATAVNRLENSTAKSKVVILLTDGENNAGQIKPLDAARLAQTFGIRVYTIGVGGTGKVPIGQYNPWTGREEIVYMDSKIDEETLEAMAELTGGQYYRAQSKRKLAEIYQEIDALERTKFNTTRYTQKSEEFERYLLLALLVLGLEVLLRQTLFRQAA